MKGHPHKSTGPTTLEQFLPERKTASGRAARLGVYQHHLASYRECIHSQPLTARHLHRGGANTDSGFHAGLPSATRYDSIWHPHSIYRYTLRRCYWWPTELCGLECLHHLQTVSLSALESHRPPHSSLVLLQQTVLLSRTHTHYHRIYRSL